MGSRTSPKENGTPGLSSAAAAPAIEVDTDAVGKDKVPSKAFSWLDPHPIFVIMLVGPEETPFGIQKDLLCSKSQYLRDYFNVREEGAEETVERIFKMPDIPVQVFCRLQLFLYTGDVVVRGGDSSPDSEHRDRERERVQERERIAERVDESSNQRSHGMPPYDVLVGVWKVGYYLVIDGLCESALAAMVEQKRTTQTIPDTPLLVQVWKDAPAGSSIRQLLLSWAAQYLRTSQERSEFARSLPQELLSELVVVMSSHSGGGGGGRSSSRSSSNDSVISIGSDDFSLVSPPSTTAGGGRHHRTRKNARPLSDGPGDDYGDSEGKGNMTGTGLANKRVRLSDHYSSSNGSGKGRTDTAAAAAAAVAVATNGRAAAAGRTALPKQHRIVSKKRGQAVGLDSFTPEQRLKFCSDLLTRMLSGPGFWTRLVGPFREPVDPSIEGIPDYPDKIKRPMDLGTIKDNLDCGRYRSEDEFAADMRQIFANVYTYWKRGDPVWLICERLEHTFEEKYAQMNKWLCKMGDDDT